MQNHPPIIRKCDECPMYKDCQEYQLNRILTVSTVHWKSRVLTPDEFDRIEVRIPKFRHKLLFRVSLATGMRYKELQYFIKSKGRWLIEKDNKLYIHIPKEHKVKRTMLERWIRLSHWGENQVRDLFVQKPLPTYPSNEAWHQNLHRWAIKAGICPLYLSPKSTRKTWESWLITVYPEHFPTIVGSQGHTATVSMAHYQNLAFTREDREKMMKYVEGWKP